MKIKKLTLMLVLAFTFFVAETVNIVSVNAMPFYDLKPQNLVVRAEFSTRYQSSTPERKNNIYIASKSINNTLVDVGAEFSFNYVVGARTLQRGYQNAKIIVNGEFVEGVGGGVCQVSTTLYNAVLLAGLTVIEFHPHSLPVGYVAPSFDAMVNSGTADLKFINNTHNPVIINTFADGDRLLIRVYGEPMTEKYELHSVVVEEIPAPKEEETFDNLGEYPDLFEGESRVVKYGKAGLKSEGYIIVTKNGKRVSTRKLRTDKYNARRGLIVHGKAIRPIEERVEQENSDDNSEIKENFLKR